MVPGSFIAHYRITAKLGEGGMGTVYRATDTKLSRDVAVKILPESFASDRDRLARFTREAQVLASLNHPNIAAIYGVEERALVMELVEGEELRGPLPLNTALDYGRQIADALEAAHEKGIIHRDLKPANIKVTSRGVVKVLDFGLAAVAQRRPEDSDTSSTLTLSATRTGTIMGSAGYMAPEQARGETADKRADIWAFGVVLYEMLVGRRLFEGATAADIMAAALVTEPDLSKAPAAVHKLLGRCLERDARKRLRDIGDAMALVEESGGGPVPRRPSRLPWIVAAGISCVAAAAGIAWWRAPQPVPPPQLRVDIDVGPDIALAMMFGSSSVIISPDGTRIIYAASVAGGPPQLFLRKLDEPKSIPLPGTQGANSPFFSPDSQWAGFNIGEKLYKISLEGGPPLLLGSPGPSPGSHWTEDGFITTGVLLKGLLRIPAGGGDAVILAKLAANEFSHTALQVLPGGKAVLYSMYDVRANQEAKIEVLSLADQRKTVVGLGTKGRYLAATAHDGYVVFAMNTSLSAVPFDLGRLERRGQPVRLLDDIGFHPITHESQFELSRTGTLVYQKAGESSAAPTTMVQSVDAAGKRVSLLSRTGVYSGARLSPDGKRLVAEVEEAGSRTIQVYDLQREIWTPVTRPGRRYALPVWTADGQFLILGSLAGLYWTRAEGAGEPELLIAEKAIFTPAAVASDGKRLFYVNGGANQAEIWSAPLESTGGRLKAGAPERFLNSGFTEWAPALSVDGQWLAYESNSSGTTEVYVRRFPDNGSLVKISTSGGRTPVWARTGHELFFQAGDEMLAVSYSDKGGVFVPDKPRVWVAKVGGTASGVFDDGKRVLVVAPVDRPNIAKAEHEVVLFPNFAEYLRQHVPAGGK